MSRPACRQILAQSCSTHIRVSTFPVMRNELSPTGVLCDAHLRMKLYRTRLIGQLSLFYVTQWQLVGGNTPWTGVPCDGSAGGIYVANLRVRRVARVAINSSLRRDCTCCLLSSRDPGTFRQVPLRCCIAHDASGHISYSRLLCYRLYC